MHWNYSRKSVNKFDQYRNLRIIIYIILCLLISIQNYGQVRNITAKVVDASTKNPIKNVTVNIADTEIFTKTNIAGYFQVEFEGDRKKLIFSHPAYEQGIVELGKLDKFLVPLTPLVTNLESLNLTDFPLNLTRGVNKSPVDSKTLVWTVNASYSAGWNKFYKEIGKSITSHPQFIDRKFQATVYFSPAMRLRIGSVSELLCAAKPIFRFARSCCQDCPGQKARDPCAPR